MVKIIKVEIDEDEGTAFVKCPKADGEENDLVAVPICLNECDQFDQAIWGHNSAITTSPSAIGCRAAKND